MRRGLVVVCFAALLACSDDGGDVDAFCTTAERFAVDNPAAVIGRVDLGDPAGTAAALRTAADELGGWADDAPDEVAGDVEVLADTAELLATTFSETSLQSTDEYVPVDTAAVEAASTSVLAFTREACGVDLDPVGP